jgi:hypothetical protein
MPANSPGMGEMDGKLSTFTLEGKLYSNCIYPVIQ